MFDQVSSLLCGHHAFYLRGEIDSYLLFDVTQRIAVIRTDLVPQFVPGIR